MLILAVVALAGTAMQPATIVQPAFDPMRGHTWQESTTAAHTVETTRGATAEEPNPPANAKFLRYLPEATTHIEFLALGFDEGGLDQIIYPLHLPSGDGERLPDSLPDRFRAVRDWLVAQYGEPAAFTSDTDARKALFEDVQVLLELEDYRYFYTWCSPGANAFLNAQRTGGSAPVIVASVESPQRPVDPDDVEMGHGCAPE